MSIMTSESIPPPPPAAVEALQTRFALASPPG